MLDTRPSINKYFIDMAHLVARRSTCMRRSVGCVLVDDKNRVIATGYNGVARGQPHCNEPPFAHACPGAFAPSGMNLEGCGAIHAEQNALIQCRDVDAIATCYVTAFPCNSCLKLLLGTPCQFIVYAERYGNMESSLHLWAPRQTLHFTGDDA